MQSIRDHLHALLRDEAGEGVISTGIVILIMALLGAAMWATFDGVMTETGNATKAKIDAINDDSDG